VNSATTGEEEEFGRLIDYIINRGGSATRMVHAAGETRDILLPVVIKPIFRWERRGGERDRKGVHRSYHNSGAHSGHGSCVYGASSAASSS